MQSDPIGLLCQQNETILLIGMRLFVKVNRKIDKITEVRKSIRNDTHRLGHLYAEFKDRSGTTSKYNNAMDMFNRVNFWTTEKGYWHL